MRPEVKEVKKRGEAPAREALMPYMRHLYAFVRREVMYYEALGLLPEQELDPQEVVGEVVAIALQLWEQRPGGSPRPWLLQLALRRLRQYLQAAQRRPSEEIPLEELISHEDQVTLDADTELWEFYEPDDVMAWEDLLPDASAPIPDEFLSQAELSEPLSNALAHLGPRVREVFVLYALEGLREEEIARMYGWDVERVKEYLIVARDSLREQLGLPPAEALAARLETQVERGTESHGH